MKRERKPKPDTGPVGRIVYSEVDKPRREAKELQEEAERATREAAEKRGRS